LDIKGQTSLKKALSNLRTPEQKAKCLTAAGQNVSNSSATNLCFCIGYLDLKGQDIVKRVYSIFGKSPTLTTMQGGYRQPKIFNGIRVRRLTPLECFRLQGFPDDIYYLARKLGISDSQLYKMTGNAVTVQVVQSIARKLIKPGG
jgi:site-specific DNA-cytosine methylase